MSSSSHRHVFTCHHMSSHVITCHITCRSPHVTTCCATCSCKATYEAGSGEDAGREQWGNTWTRLCLVSWRLATRWVHNMRACGVTCTCMCHACYMYMHVQLMWRFVASEEDYVSQLTILNEEYRQQFEIAAASRKPPLTLKQSNDIFRNRLVVCCAVAYVTVPSYLHTLMPAVTRSSFYIRWFLEACIVVLTSGQWLCLVSHGVVWGMWGVWWWSWCDVVWCEGVVCELSVWGV